MVAPVHPGDQAGQDLVGAAQPVPGHVHPGVSAEVGPLEDDAGAHLWRATGEEAGLGGSGGRGGLGRHAATRVSEHAFVIGDSRGDKLSAKSVLSPRLSADSKRRAWMLSGWAFIMEGMSRPSRRPAPPPATWVVQFGPLLAAAGLLLVVVLGIANESSRALRASGGWLIFGGQMFGLTGTYLLLVMVLLIGRIPLLERSIGQDRLVRWHRQIGPWPLCLLGAHAIFITLGYAEADRTGFLHELWLLITTYPDVLAAVVALALMVMAGVASFRAARRRMRYETWWVVHLYTYLALALGFAHQLANGVSFVGHPLARAVWVVLWAATAGTVMVFRIGMPLWRTLRHRLRVVEVREEGPGVVSVICAGRKLDRLAVSGGQFFQWRFLVRGQWWQAHPYSLSALPRPPYLRVTVKGLGDQSHALALIPEGTRVAIEGPYGVFTDHARQRGRVLLVAAGVGVTPDPGPA